MGLKMENHMGGGDEDESNSGGEEDLFGHSKKCDSADDNGKEGAV